MSAHTPGPWRRCAGSKRFYINGGGIHIATVFSLDGPRPHDEEHEEFPVAVANSRLIAAAPDLLAALRQMMRDYAGDMGYGWEATKTMDNFAQAHHALDRAEGRT